MSTGGKRVIMRKYWLVVAMLGAVGCSGAPVEEPAGSNQSAVTDKGDGESDDMGELADGTKPADGTELPNAGEPASGSKVPGEPGPTCDEQLAAIADMTADVTDAKVLANLKQKYEQLRLQCAANEGTVPAEQDPSTKPSE